MNILFIIYVIVLLVSIIWFNYSCKENFITDNNSNTNSNTNDTIFVSAYYHVSNKYDKTFYIEKIKNLLNHTPKIKWVIFTNKESLEYLPQQTDRLQYIICPFQDFYVYKYIDSFKKQKEEDIEKYHNIELYMIWNEKVNFVKKAVDLYPYINNFCWMDIGCIRDPKLCPYMKNFPDYVKLQNICKDNKITFLQLGTDNTHFLDRNEKGLSKINKSSHHIICLGATIFFGNRSTFKILYNNYYELIELYYKYDFFFGKDQNIFANLYINHPEYFNIIKPFSEKTQLDEIQTDQWFYFINYLMPNKKLTD